MLDLTNQQLVSIALIVFPGIFISLMALFLRKRIGFDLIKFGLFLVFVGLVLLVIDDGTVLELITLKSLEASGRAYLAGCMFVFSGVLSELLYGLAQLLGIKFTSGKADKNDP